MTRLVGREEEVERVLGSVHEGRLNTLTGPGGIGKSRLARAVTERALRSRRKQILWVPVARLARPEDVALEIARAGGAHAGRNGSPLDSVATLLENGDGLVVLDDCEHLVDAVAEAVSHLLERAPGFRFLLTSREPLGIPGEVTWSVPPLSLPAEDTDSAAELLESGAGTLFLERAAEAKPGFRAQGEDARAIARICRMLDGIPLALELAAARVRVLALGQLADRLEGSLDLLTGGNRSELPRRRTMYSAIAWSFDLMGPGEQALFAALSVFRGTWTLEAAEAIGSDAGPADDGAPPPTDRPDVLADLTGLVDRSMVQVREFAGVSRYGLLEPLRLFARDVLAQRGPAEERKVRERHAHYHAGLVGVAALDETGRDFDWTRVQTLAVEQDNIREALEWGEQEDCALALRMAADLGWFWIALGLWTEGSERVERLLETCVEVDNRTRARALSTAASLSYMLGSDALAHRRSSEAVTAWRGLDAPLETARALTLLASVQADAGMLEPAMSAMKQAFDLAETEGSGQLLPWLLASRAAVHRTLGLLEQADADYSEALRLADSTTFSHSWAFETPHARVLAALAAGDVTRAWLHARSAIQFIRLADSPWLRARTVLACAALAARADDDAMAALLLGAVDALDTGDSVLLPHEEDMRAEIKSRLEERLGSTAETGIGLEGASLTLAETLERAELYLLERTGSGARTVRGVAIHEPAGAFPTPTTGLPASRTALEVRALGPLETYRNGVPIADAAWRYSRPRELLLFLLCHPRGRTREQIGLALWPDASSDHLRNNFHVALHRLRRVLGSQDSVVVDRDVYRLDPEMSVSFDADRFEQQLKESLRIPAPDRDGEAAEALRSALSLYRGEFLEAENVGDWHLERRDHLRHLFLEGQMALGEWSLGQGALLDATEAFRRVIQVDDLREDAHRFLMTCRARGGDRAGAQRLYQQLVERLKAELDSDPEPETIQLADRLRRGLVD